MKTAFRIGAGRAFSPGAVILWCAVLLLAPAQPTWASHHRGTDTWAEVGANGIVTAHVTTRWTKGSFGDPTLGTGVDSARFGTERFFCEETGDTVVVSPPTALRIIKVLNGSTVYEWPAGSFSLSATTVDIDTSAPTFDARSQALIIPFGTTSAVGQIVAPLNLPFGDYDIRWNDWSRIRGLVNIDPTDPCGGLDDGFGFNIRVHWDGTVNHGPAFGPVSPIVARGLPYNQNVNASDADGDPRTYFFASLNSFDPDFGPQTQVPGLTLNSLTGQLTIPSTSTAGLLDNFFSEPAADYLVKVRVSDSRGAISEREILLDAVTTTGEAAADASLRVAHGSGSSLQIAWTPACNATNHVVYWGALPLGGTLLWKGAACALGTTGSANFDPGNVSPGTALFFVVVGRNPASEGSYGKSSAGAERPEATGIGSCDLAQVLGGCSP